MAKKIFRIAGPLILLAYFITLVLHISANSDQYQWDFRTHRLAGEIFASGSDPYDPAVLSIYSVSDRSGYVCGFYPQCIHRCG
jgi:hypothetical protein